METQLDRIAKVAKENPKEKFTSLIHLINEENLIKCQKNMSTGKSSGVDEVTKEQYSEQLAENVEDLHRRVAPVPLSPQA